MNQSTEAVAEAGGERVEFDALNAAPAAGGEGNLDMILDVPGTLAMGVRLHP